jgi:hypothetical protein
MGRFDESGTKMHERHAANLIHLVEPESEPLTRARGIGIGALLGAVMWVAVFALGAAVWQLFHPT